MKRIAMLFAAFILAVTGIAATATPANAHLLTVYHGSDRAWVRADHQRLTVEDNECDSHSIYAYYKTGIMIQAGQDWKRIVDENGCDPGASYIVTGDGGYEFELIKVCEHVDEENRYGCTNVAVA